MFIYSILDLIRDEQLTEERLSRVCETQSDAELFVAWFLSG